MLQRLGRTAAARAAYREILVKDAASVEARRGLTELSGEKKYELRIGADFDHFSYAENGRAFSENPCVAFFSALYIREQSS